MSVRGTISVDVAFTDSTTVSGAQSLKTIVLRDATEYTTGQVAIVTATVGTASRTFASILSGYRNAAGETVSFSSVYRLALQSSGPEVRYLVSPFAGLGPVSMGGVSIVDVSSSVQSPATHNVVGTAGTAAFTLVIYGT
jgi:hypothetical protein